MLWLRDIVRDNCIRIDYLDTTHVYNDEISCNSMSIRHDSFRQPKVPFICLILAAKKRGRVLRRRRSRDCATMSHRTKRRLSLTDTQLSVSRQPPRRVNVSGCCSCALFVAICRLQIGVSSGEKKLDFSLNHIVFFGANKKIKCFKREKKWI